jgi:hypothetical protein
VEENKNGPSGGAACASSERDCYSNATATPPVVEVVVRVVVLWKVVVMGWLDWVRERHDRHGNSSQ